MELQLFRHDVIQTATAAQGTLAVLPASEDKKSQKVAVGDLSGVVQCFGVKRSEVAVVFKTLPCPQKVTSLTLGRGRTQRDRIFVAQGDTIKGLSRKGKEFFKFNTQVTEGIRKVDVHEKDIWSAGEYVHNHFEEAKDKAFYLAPDRINDAEVVPFRGPAGFLPVLACQDRTIRVLQGANVLYETATASAPICAKFINESHDMQNRYPDGKELLVGTEGGTLVQLLMAPEGANAGFTLPNPKKLGAIKCIYSAIDFTRTGTNDIVVGREDGQVEVYDVDEMGHLQLVFQSKLSESVTAVDGGFITSPSVPEFVLQTFSGKVITYAPAGGGIQAPLAAAAVVGKNTPQVVRAKGQDEAHERRTNYNYQITRLRADIEGLHTQLEAERSKFAKGSGDNALLAVSAQYTIQHKCTLVPEEACYVLSIESAMPIFAVAIQCNIQLQLLDVPSNVAILSRSPPDEANGNMTLATYRCQESTSRISVKFKVREGKVGALQALVIPQVTPKICMSATHKIKPLCLHARVPAFEQVGQMNELLLTGTFGVSDVHSWVSSLLPEVPPQLPPGSDTGAFYFHNTLLDTLLSCKYRAGEARFASDLISSLGILHEHVMREATNGKHRVNVSFNPSSLSLQHSIGLVWPKLERNRTLRNKYRLLEGLQELKMQDPDVSYLAAEYRDMLENAEAIKTEFQEQPQHLDHLTTLIKDLYTDFCKLSGISAPKQRLPALEQLLADPKSTLEQVMEFMLNR